MADRGDTHYHVPLLNRWFLLASVSLLVSVFWMVIDDWNREWKDYQREFREIELAQAEGDLATLEEHGVLDEKESLEVRVAAAERGLGSKRAEILAADKGVYAATEARYVAEQRLKGLKGDFSWAKQMQEERFELPGYDVQQAARNLQALLDQVNAAELEFEVKDAEYQAAQRAYDALVAERTAAEKALAGATRDLDRVEKRIESIQPSDVATKVANIIRDFPGLDFIGPNLKIQKYVLSNLTFELNFTKKTRIDMCTTCHMGIEREDFEDPDLYRQPYTTHPRLDLYLTAKSPHPAKDMGCTICHRGAGEALSFQHADHRPSDEDEEQVWHERHHWHKQHHWDYPMLSSEFIEASCVQCHKTSMELIAGDAPRVTEGYRLFERYGCYACHKVDWFPTKRRPGPSLKNLAAKVTPDFVDPWIKEPKAFRPTTWMPQVFHLENLPDDEVVVVSEYGHGREILGREWNDSAVAAITAFLFANHPELKLPEIPVEGAPDRGREVFNVVGCTACHNMAEFPGEEEEFPNATFVAREFNTKGPNLRGVATKIDRKWLYHWIKDPQAYWSETLMPNLRLSDQDAADIVAYMMDDPDGIFHDVPDGWQTGPSPESEDALKEQVRWFYTKLGRREIERRLGAGGEWSDVQSLKVAVGSALVRNHGCYSCHEVRGLETEMPIGTELSNWGSKTVDKLDFGLAYRTKVAGLPKLDHDYREGWIERKLLHPRSFDLDKVKNPKDKLRMPQFHFTEDQAQAVATFVVGLVDDEVQRAKMVPSPEQLAMDTGMRIVRQKNCMACHVIDPGTLTYEHESGEIVTIMAEIAPFPGNTLQPTMASKEALVADMQAWAEELGEDVPEELVARVLEAHGTVGGPTENAFIPLDKLIAVTPARGGEFVRTVMNYYRGAGYGAGINVPNPDYDPEDEDSYPYDPVTYGYDEGTGDNLIEDVDGVARAYAAEEYDKVRWTFAPPVLVNEGHKLQREWFFAFLEDPVTIRGQMRVRMPSFTFAPGEAESVADYFAFKAIDEWYPRYAHRMRLLLGRERLAALEDPTAHGWPDELQTTWPAGLIMTESGGGLTVAEVAAGSGLAAAQVAAIEAGDKGTIEASFADLQRWGESQGFAMVGAVGLSYEAIQRRQPSYHPEIELGARLASSFDTDGNQLGVNCYQCHFVRATLPDQVDAPLAWAPNLDLARARLREDYVWEWLWSPKFIYPGTAMADNFAAHLPQYQAAGPGTNNEEQIRAVMDWLFNLEKTPVVTD